MLADAYNSLLKKVRDDPYPILADLRKQNPILWHSRFNVWFVLTYAHGKKLFTHKDLIENSVNPIRSHIYPPAYADEVNPLCNALEKWLVFSNPPFHTHLRRLLNPYFSEHKIEKLTGSIQQKAESSLFNQNNEFDLLADFSKPLMMHTIISLLDLPLTDGHKIIAWVDDVAQVVNGIVITPDTYRPAVRAIAEAENYLKKLIADVISGQMKNNFISELHLTLKQDNFLSEDLLWHTLFMLLSAGYETSSNLIANGVLALIQNPLQMEKLRQHPELIDSAIEEMLRYDAPVQAVFRQAIADIEIDNFKIKKNDFVYLSILAMNRDPEQFNNPDSFDITRSPNQHFAFGHGIHFCLGRLLAKKAAKIAILTLLEKFKHIKLIEQDLQWHAGLTLRKLKKLLVLQS